MERDSHLWALAARQHWLLSTEQLHDAGLTTAAIEHRRRTGRLHAVRRGVWAVGHRADTADQLLMAAVLAVTGKAVLSHRTAGFVWQILDRPPALVHVTLPTQSGQRGPKGVRVHRCRTLTDDECVAIRRLPVTSLARTLRDLAGELSPAALRAAVREAERVHRIDLRELRSTVAGRPRSRCDSRLRTLIDDYVPAELHPGAEAPFFEALVRHGIELPTTQVPFGDYVLDFVWERERLVIETDGGGGHAGWVARQADLVRDRRLAASGYLVLRFGWREISRDADAVAQEVASALRRRATASRGPVHR